MWRLAKDAGVVACVAAVTAAGVLAVARPRAVVADGEAEARPVERPTLKADGVILTLALDKAGYEAGAKPKLTLTAVNTLKRRASLRALLRMLASSRTSDFSRRMPTPKELWRSECALDLAFGETRQVEIATDAPLAAGTTVTFSLEVGKQALNAAWFTVPGAGAEGGSPVLSSASKEEPLKLLVAARAAKAQPGASAPDVDPARTAGPGEPSPAGNLEEGAR